MGKSRAHRDPPVVMLGSMFAPSVPSSQTPFSGHEGHEKANKHTEKRKFKKSVVKSSSGATQPISNGTTLSKKGKKMVPILDAAVNKEIGTLFGGDPSRYGFQPPTKPIERELPRYLIRQAPILKPIPIVQDEWDRKNQEKMLELESSISDVTTLWETLKKMRDTERQVMEEKGLVDKADQAKDLTEAITFQGTCQDMCPIFERARRSVENNVVRYEKANPNDKKVDRYRALKVFARPAAAAAPPLPSDVRPPHVLVKTLDYIVENIVPLLPDSESFLWDRMRSIRQDFTYQNYSGPEAIDCNERIVRIHLLILHQMAKTDIDFSAQQELEQLHKAIITLCEIYDEVRDQGGQCPNEAEFRAYALLSKIREPEYDKMAQDLPADVFNNDLIQLAITFRRILMNSNHIERGVVVTENCMNLYDRFFQLIQSDKVPFFMASFLEIYLNEIRFYGFKYLSLAVTKKGGNLPYQYFMEHFLFRDDLELETFCKYYSIDFADGKITLKSLTSTSHLLPETKPLKKNWLHCVEQKLQNSNTSELINNRKENTDTISSGRGTVLDNVTTVDLSKNYDNYKDISNNNIFERQNEAENYQAFGFMNGNQDTRNFQSADQNNKPAFGIQPPMDIIQNNGKLNKPKLLNSTPSFTPSQPNTTGTTLSKQEELANKLKEQKEKLRRQKVLEEEQLLAREQEIQRKKHENDIKKQKEIEERRRQALEKKQERVEKLSKELLATILKERVSNTVKTVLQQQKKRQVQIDNLCKSLFKSFIHERLYFIFLEVRAEKFRNKHLYQHSMSKWKAKFERRRKENELKRKKQEEALRLSKELGIGRRIPSLRSSSKRERMSANNTMHETSSFINSNTTNYSTPLYIEENHFTTPVRNNSDIWMPLDLKKTYFEKVATKLDNVLERGDLDSKVTLDIVLYSKSWDCLSGVWLLSKFHLAETVSHKIENSSLCTNFLKLDNEYKANEFSNVNLVIFNTGVTDSDIFDLDMKLQKDGERLIELICGVAFNTSYRFKLLVIYWESIENPKSVLEIKHQLKINKVLKRFGDIIYDTEIVKIMGPNPESFLKQGLSNAANDFEFKLSDRGVYMETRKRRTLAGCGNDSHDTTSTKENSASIDERMQSMLKQEQSKAMQNINKKTAYSHLKNHVMASPRSRYKKLPVLLSDSHKPKYKTPVPLQGSRKSSITATEDSNPSHLVKKVRTTSTIPLPPHPVSGTFGTPSQPRNLLNHTSVLTTPQLTCIGPQNATAPSMSSAELTTSNAANISTQSDFATPAGIINPVHVHQQRNALKDWSHASISVQGPTKSSLQDISAHETPTAGNVPPSIRELQSIIAVVKKKLQDRR